MSDMPKTASATLLKDLVLKLLEKEAWGEVRQALVGQHPADIAEIISSSPSETQERLFLLADEEIQPDVLAHLSDRAEAAVLERLTSEQISDLVEDMAPDDAADVIADLSDERSAEVLGLMEQEESADVRGLLQYDEESAGGLMTPDLLSFKDTLTVAQALDQITLSDEDEPVYNAYVVNHAGHLVGAIGIWELLKIRDRGRTLAEVAHTDIVSATTDTDQEEVARLIAKYDLTALAVVDPRGRLVGRITIDDVIDVVQEEASEDIFRLAGSDDAELMYRSPFHASRVRLPWLLVTMAITFAGSLILKRFMLDLAEVLALSFFVPIVMAMCGSTGMQSSTLLIRRLALHSLEGESPLKLLGRELITGVLMGLVCGGILGLWAQFVITMSPEHHATYPPLFLAFAAGSALLVAMSFAAMYGAFIPIVLNRFRIDPAVASGPFVTASNDIIALLIYYGATLALIGLYHHMGGGGP